LHLCISDGVFTTDGDFYAAWDWKPEELKEKLRRRILKAFVRWEKLTPEAADIVACWELDKCGFSLFIGSPIAEDDRERLARLLRYLMRSPVSFKRLKYDERTGKVTMRLKRDQVKVFDHAVDFLAALARHVPRARQQTVTYAGHYANATGNLSLKKDEAEQKDEQEVSVQPGGRGYVPWNLLVLRCWAVDPELCPRCGERMERDKPVYKQPALSQLLKSLRVGKYPQRPPPAPPPQTQAASNHDSEYSNAQQFGDNVVQLFPDDNFNQVPPGW
jgi:hypothetical protein